MWARVKEATKTGSRSGAWATYWRMRGVSSPAVLDYLRSIHVGRTAPPVEENWDSEEVEEMGYGEEQAE